MFAFVTIVEPQIDSLNAAGKGALKSHIFGAPKAGDRWNVPVLCDAERRLSGFQDGINCRAHCADTARHVLRTRDAARRDVRVTGRPHLLRYFGCA